MNVGQKASKIKFEYEEDNEIEETTATVSSVLEEDSAMCDLDGSIIGADQTSADYYFDSYSHFGNNLLNPIYIYINLLQCIEIIGLSYCIWFMFFAGIHEVSNVICIRMMKS